MIEIIAAYWLSCADGDLAYCAPNHFQTESQCYATAGTWPYGDDGECLLVVVYHQHSEDTK